VSANQPPRRPRIRFRFDTVLRGLDVEEAAILETWLSKTRTIAAQRLAKRVRAAMQEVDHDAIDLDSDDLTALRDALAGVDVGQYAGLSGLQQTLHGTSEA
jgi:hypothetical protein